MKKKIYIIIISNIFNYIIKCGLTMAIVNPQKKVRPFQCLFRGFGSTTKRFSCLVLCCIFARTTFMYYNYQVGLAAVEVQGLIDRNTVSDWIRTQTNCMSIGPIDSPFSSFSDSDIFQDVVSSLWENKTDFRWSWRKLYNCRTRWNGEWILYRNGVTWKVKAKVIS